MTSVARRRVFRPFLAIALSLLPTLVFGLGLLFGAIIYGQLRNLRVHEAMREMSELIYETCKTYLIQQGKFLAVLWVFIGAVTAFYFGTLAPVGDGTHGFPAGKVAI